MVIRVGGGYMVVEEFIATYQDPELLKLEKLSPEQYEALAGQGNQVSVDMNPNARLSQYRASLRKNSPGGDDLGKNLVARTS